MAAIVRVTWVPTGVEDAAPTVGDNLNQGRQPSLHRLSSYFAALAGGSKRGAVTVTVATGGDSTKASATVTCDQASVSAPDTITIGDTVLTLVASSPGTDEFLAGASDTEMATNLAAAINAQASLRQVLAATSAAGVVTITASEPGVFGNLIKLETDNASAFTLSATSLSGGTGTEELAPTTYTV